MGNIDTPVTAITENNEEINDNTDVGITAERIVSPIYANTGLEIVGDIASENVTAIAENHEIAENQEEINDNTDVVITAESIVSPVSANTGLEIVGDIASGKLGNIDVILVYNDIVASASLQIAEIFAETVTNDVIVLDTNVAGLVIPVFNTQIDEQTALDLGNGVTVHVANVAGLDVMVDTQAEEQTTDQTEDLVQIGVVDGEVMNNIAPDAVITPKSEVKKTDLHTPGEATVANPHIAVADNYNEEIGSDTPQIEIPGEFVNHSNIPVHIYNTMVKHTDIVASAVEDILTTTVVKFNDTADVQHPAVKKQTGSLNMASPATDITPQTEADKNSGNMNVRAEEDVHDSVLGAPAMMAKEVSGDVMNHMASDAALVTTDADTVNCELELRKPAIVTVLCSPNTHSAVKTGSKKGMVLSLDMDKPKMSAVELTTEKKTMVNHNTQVDQTGEIDKQENEPVGEFVNHSQAVIEALDTALVADARFLDTQGEVDNQENGSVAIKALDTALVADARFLDTRGEVDNEKQSKYSLVPALLSITTIMSQDTIESLLESSSKSRNLYYYHQ